MSTNGQYNQQLRGSVAPGGVGNSNASANGINSVSPSVVPSIDTTKFVLDYLKRKGFSRTEAEFRLESSNNTPPASRSSTDIYGSSSGVQSGSNPAVAGSSGPTVSRLFLGKQNTAVTKDLREESKLEINWRAYLALSEWTENSLDLYKPELRRVLYPVFVHLYLDLIVKGMPTRAKAFFEEFAPSHAVLHTQDLQKLSMVSLPSHLTDNDLAKAFKSNKYSIRVSRTTFDLLVYFLHEIEESGGSIIIRIINQYIKANITTVRPSRFDNEIVVDAEEGLPGLIDAQTELDTFNSQPIKLGKLPLDPDFEKDVETILERRDNDNKEINNDSNLEPPSLVAEFHKLNEKEADSPLRTILPLPQYKTADILAEVRAVEDVQNRIPVGPLQSSLPSVCMYTFHNSHDDLNAIEFSQDSALVAGGFADSFIKIWSLKGDKLQGILREDVPSTSKRLIGHSGAVYGLSFSPDNKYLVSSSEDKTVRLWSMDTYTSLVSYKGHNHPVWDVAFNPFGHYFATASHDQTARLWSCDHIYPLRIFAGHLSDVDTIGWHPNGTYFVTGSSDKTCRMWDINKGTSVRVFPGHTGPVTCTTISPDGRWLATAGEDSLIHVFDIGSGHRLKTMKGHGKCSIYSLAFSKEGSVLVSAGSDNSVRVWDVKKNTGDDQQEHPIDIYYTNSSNSNGGGGGVSGSTKSVNGTNNSSSPSNSTNAAGSNGNGNGSEQQSKRKGDIDPNEGRKKKEISATLDHLAVFNTKKTPVYKVQFTNRNLCIAGGAYMG